MTLEPFMIYYLRLRLNGDELSWRTGTDSIVQYKYRAS